MSSDIVRDIDFSKRGFFQTPKPWSPYAYLRPCWVYEHSLFVWCDEHLRWNEHGANAEERIPGTITSRVPHHCKDDGDRCEGIDFYCLGEATPGLAKIFHKYPNKKVVHTPPPTRRVYPQPQGGNDER